jgi:hypothetical protein
MTDRPMLFSAPMIQAILREIENPGTGKTQTRRLPKIKGRPGFFDFGKSDTKGYDWTYRRKDHVWEDLRHEELLKRLPIAVGDSVWVREHWKSVTAYDDLSPSEMGGEESVLYLADGATQDWGWANPNVFFGRRRQAMHMPRWASRLTLEVTEVRVERLQDISTEDAIAEGLPQYRDGAGMDWFGFSDIFDGISGCPIIAFSSLWNSINGSDAWDHNPWVVAYSFKPFLCNIDQMEKAA